MENRVIKGVEKGMAMILTFFSWIGMILGSLVLVLLVIPLRIRINGRVGDQAGFGYEWGGDWALGMIGVEKIAGHPVRLSVLGLRVLHFSGSRREKKKKAETNKQRKRWPGAMAGTLKNNFQAVIHVLDQMAGAAFLQGRLIGRIGLPDPADTANVALICRMINRRSGRFALSLACEYDEPVIRIEASVKATLIVGYLAVVACRLMLLSQTRVMLRSLRHA
jgi:hypothetical protein